MRVIVAAVTRYTTPGDRVLIQLPPPTPRALPSRDGWAPVTDPYRGLAEAVWVIHRLGRSAITTHSPTTPPHHRDRAALQVEGHATASVLEPTSGDRTATGTADQDPDRTHTRPSTDAAIESVPTEGVRLPTPPAQSESAPRSDPDKHDSRAPSETGVDLVITAVHPRATDWLAGATDPTPQTRNATLIVLTHSDPSGERLVDPLPLIVATQRSYGRRWLDHIAAQSAPLPNPRAAARPPLRAADHATSIPAHRGDAPAEPPLARSTVHHDLAVFSPVTRPATHLL